MAVKQNRAFAFGDRVKIAKKSRVVDTERKQEGDPTEERPPIDVDVTGEEGEVCAEPYESTHRGEFMVPIRLRNEAVVAVPEDRVERAKLPSPSEQRGQENVALGDSGQSAVGRETIEFWRNYFAMEKESKGKDKQEE